MCSSASKKYVINGTQRHTAPRRQTAVRRVRPGRSSRAAVAACTWWSPARAAPRAGAWPGSRARRRSGGRRRDPRAARAPPPRAARAAARTPRRAAGAPGMGLGLGLGLGLGVGVG
eukprot:scaffold30179_cov42-Phaeocystis_antarctica.AAC.1